MHDRDIPNFGYNNETHVKILNMSTEMFAARGYEAVSLRDIAKEVGIKEPTIYYYYKSKEVLWEDVLSRFEAGYRHYFDWLREGNKDVDSPETLMDNFFNKEFVEMLDPIGCLGMSIVIKEQHTNASARKLVFDLLFGLSVKSIQADFDRLIEKGTLPPSDTKMIATIFMYGVMTINDIRLHEYWGNLGTKPPVNCKEMYADLRKIIEMLLGMTTQT